MRLILCATLYTLLGGEAWAQSPPTGCLPSVPDAKLRPIEEIGNLRAWVQLSPTSGSSACVQIDSCAWRLDETSLLSGPISTYASPNPDGICGLVSTGDRICSNPQQLEQQFGSIAQMVGTALADTGTYCSSGTNKVHTSGAYVANADGSTMTLLILPVDDYCLNLVGRNGNAAIIVTTSCANTVGVAALQNELTPQFFASHQFWIAGVSDSLIFGLPINLSGSNITIENATQVIGFPNVPYVENWLAKVYVAANTLSTKPGDLDRDNDPLPEMNSGHEVGALIHWIAAAVARLEPTPFDESEGWSERGSKNAQARNWMATLELTGFVGTHFRAEIARN